MIELADSRLAIQHRLDTESVGVQAEACNRAYAGGTNKRCVAELLTRGYIRDVNLYHRHCDSTHSITQRYGGVCIASGVEQDTIVLPLRLVESVDQLPLDIGLGVVNHDIGILGAEARDKLLE